MSSRQEMLAPPALQVRPLWLHCFMFHEGLGFRVIRVWDLGLRVQDLGLRV